MISKLNQALCRGDCNPNHIYKEVCHFKLNQEPFCQLIKNAISEGEKRNGK